MSLFWQADYCSNKASSRTAYDEQPYLIEYVNDYGATKYKKLESFSSFVRDIMSSWLIHDNSQILFPNKEIAEIVAETIATSSRNVDAYVRRYILKVEGMEIYGQIIGCILVWMLWRIFATHEPSKCTNRILIIIICIICAFLVVFPAATKMTRNDIESDVDEARRNTMFSITDFGIIVQTDIKLGCKQVNTTECPVTIKGFTYDEFQTCLMLIDQAINKTKSLKSLTEICAQILTAMIVSFGFLALTIGRWWEILYRGRERTQQANETPSSTDISVSISPTISDSTSLEISEGTIQPEK